MGAFKFVAETSQLIVAIPDVTLRFRLGARHLLIPACFRSFKTRVFFRFPGLLGFGECGFGVPMATIFGLHDIRTGLLQLFVASRQRGLQPGRPLAQTLEFCIVAAQSIDIGSCLRDIFWARSSDSVNSVRSLVTSFSRLSSDDWRFLTLSRRWPSSAFSARRVIGFGP